MFIKQDPMRRVVYSLLPIFAWSVWLYGWRSIAVLIAVLVPAVLTELVVEKSRNKKVSEAVLVTSFLLALSLPPAVPLWVAMVASVFSILMGKEVYGGFGRNIFNPAITGRIFTYISFPLLMQTTWMFPGFFGMQGMNNQVLGSTWTEAAFVIPVLAALWFVIKHKPESTRHVAFTVSAAIVLFAALYVTSAFTGWRGIQNLEVDALASATPLEIMRGLGNQWNPPAGLAWLKGNDPLMLFLGLRVGSLGEGPIFLILLAALYLILTKTANWKLVLSSFGSALLLSVLLYYTGAMSHKLVTMNPAGKDLAGQFSDITAFLMAGSLVFVCVFMATDPVTAPKKVLSQWVYGTIIGVVTILIRVFSGFPEGVSFGILMANTFSSLLDEVLPSPTKKNMATAPVTSPDQESRVIKASGKEGTS